MPSTEAGKRLLDAHIDCQGYCEVWAAKLAIEEIEDEARDQSVTVRIAAIEAEAAAAERARLAEAVRGLSVADRSWLAPSEVFAAVLAMLEENK